MKEHDATEIAFKNGYKHCAMEMIEEIDRYLYMNTRICKEEIRDDETDYFSGQLSAFLQVQGFIDANLKKKYTEG
jgi:hypothetical protein